MAELKIDMGAPLTDAMRVARAHKVTFERMLEALTGARDDLVGWNADG